MLITALEILGRKAEDIETTLNNWFEIYLEILLNPSPLIVIK